MSFQQLPATTRRNGGHRSSRRKGKQHVLVAVSVVALAMVALAASGFAAAFLVASWSGATASSESGPERNSPFRQEVYAQDDVVLAQLNAEVVESSPGLFGQSLPIAVQTTNPIQPKKIGAGSAGPRSTWTPTPLPSPSPTASPTPVPTFVSDAFSESYIRPLAVPAGERWIDVNLTSQTLVAYEGALPVFETLVSSGTARHPTVTGQFRIWLRFESQDMDGYRLGFNYYLRNVPYVQYFYQDYALHGTFWHNNFGTPMSHGCVNLPTPAAEWIFKWAENGTLVNIHH